MDYLYSYQKTPTIVKCLQNLSVMQKVIEFIPQKPQLEAAFRRKSLLKSSLFSARIEGNKLNLEDITYININTENQEKREIFNILKALEWVYRQKNKEITLELILNLHEAVLAKISPLANKLRTEPSAIFNTAGIAVYLAPPPDQIETKLRELINWINTSNEPGPIVSAVGHFAFEKIHPFLDGNGRVGRLLSTYILNTTGFGFRGLVSLEEFLENNRQTYYDFLAVNSKDITAFVEFFLEGLNFEAEKAVEKIKNAPQENVEDSLLPRRREILEIIRDHQLMTFDNLRRRFMKISPSSLHYDLKQLAKAGFIKKLGSTRGACYSPK